MLHRLHFFVIQTGFVGVIGGRDIRETTNGIMKALSLDDLSSQPNFCGEVTNQDVGALKVSRIVIGTLFSIIFSHCNYSKLDNSDHQFTASIFIKWVASSF